MPGTAVQEQSADGGTAQFEDFFRAEYRAVVRALVLVTGDGPTAEELGQEAFARAFERWARVRTMASPAGYVYRTALNLYRSRLRRMALGIRLARHDRPARAEPDTSGAHEVREMLRSPPQGQREAVMLVDSGTWPRRPRRSWAFGRPPSADGSTGPGEPCARGLEATMHDVRDVLGVGVGSWEPRDPGLEGILRRAAAHRRRERGLAAALTRAGSNVPGASAPIVGPTRVVQIPSTSMEPTLHPGDQVLVDEGAYRGSLPRRDDVIAFTVDRPGISPPGLIWVKRVIGLPGDVVAERRGKLFVNGDPVPLPARDGNRTLGPWKVGAGRLFVVGDDVANSNDSRFALGPVPVKGVIGRVAWILGPDDRVGGLRPPRSASVANPSPG